MLKKRARNINDIGDVARRSLDIVILSKLLEEPMHGYGIIKHIYDKYDLFLTPSHIYPLLYSLEEKGLINNRQDRKCKVYHIKEREKIKRMISDYLDAHRSFINDLQKEYRRTADNRGLPTDDERREQL